MERPSNHDHWQGLANLEPDSEKYKRIHRLLSFANFGFLKTRAIESRRKYEPGLSHDVECSFNQTQFSSGFNNVVLEVAFSDNVYWVARVTPGAP